MDLKGVSACLLSAGLDWLLELAPAMQNQVYSDTQKERADHLKVCFLGQYCRLGSITLGQSLNRGLYSKSTPSKFATSCGPCRASSSDTSDMEWKIPSL